MDWNVGAADEQALHQPALSMRKVAGAVPQKLCSESGWPLLSFQTMSLTF
jgi:hypothetical protein